MYLSADKLAKSCNLSKSIKKYEKFKKIRFDQVNDHVEEDEDTFDPTFNGSTWRACCVRKSKKKNATDVKILT